MRKNKKINSGPSSTTICVNALLTISLFVLSQFGYSQKSIEISGRVIHAEKATPIAFATVGIKGSPHGTVTNLEGVFSFVFPDSLVSDTLFISHIGFETYKTPASKIRDQGFIEIILKEKITELDEVQVNAEKLTATQIMQRALDKMQENFPGDHIIKGFFRDIRDQNGQTVYLVEAAIDMEDPGFNGELDLIKKFHLRGVRSSDPRIHKLLRKSLLNAGNSLRVNLERNYWINRLTRNIEKEKFMIEDVLEKDNHYFFIVSSKKITTSLSNGEQNKDLKYAITQRYLVAAETYAIHKIEHLEEPLEGKYVGIERPYEGDTLFYSTKGWNQVIEFKEHKGEMYLKYQDVSYRFDIVNQKQGKIFLDMDYRFTFIATDIETSSSKKPEGYRMNRNKSLVLQAKEYDPKFWNNLNNAKLTPLTSKQINGLEKEQPLEEQFRSKKKSKRK